MFETFSKLDNAIDEYYKQLDTFHRGLKHLSYIYEYSCDYFNLRTGAAEISIAENKLFDAIKQLGFFLYREKGDSKAKDRIMKEMNPGFVTDPLMSQGLQELMSRANSRANRLISGGKKLDIPKKKKEELRDCLIPLENAASMLEVMITFGTSTARNGK